MLSKKVNKKQLVARVQRYMGPGATQSAASAAVEAVLASILKLTARERLHITRFGSFECRERSARRYYHIPRAELDTLPPRLRLCFQPAKGFPQRNI